MTRTLHSYFDESASRDGARPALHVGGKYYSYQELRHVSQKVSRFLRASLRGDGQHCIGILSEKGLPAYAGLLGAMDSGNIYVPLNPKLPLNRLEDIANLARVKALIVDSSSVSIASQLLELIGKDVPIFLPDTVEIPSELLKYAGVSQTSGNLSGAVEPVDASPNYAYLLFTSGTTGSPKGVPVTHENPAACIEAVCEHFDFHSSDRFTQFSELSFDVSIADIFLCWKAGACLY